MDQATEERVAADAEFIAHAREDIPWLLTQLSTLQAALTEAQGCDGNCSCVIWKSRHEAAMALYANVEKLKAAEAQCATLDARLTLYIDGLTLCEAHAPERWESDGGCPICEGQLLADRVGKLESACATLTAERDEAQRELVQAASVMEGVRAALDGSPDDFMLSFQLVRAVDDLRNQRADAIALRDRAEAERDALQQRLARLEKGQ